MAASCSSLYFHRGARSGHYRRTTPWLGLVPRQRLQMSSSSEVCSPASPPTTSTVSTLSSASARWRRQSGSAVVPGRRRDRALRSSSVSSPLAGTLPPLLLALESDIALAFWADGRPATASSDQHQTVSRLSSSLAGMAIAELVRFRYQLRVAGIIVVPLVVLITFRNGMLLPVWMLATVGAYGSIQLVHWWTLLYGRVLLAFGIIVSILHDSLVGVCCSSHSRRAPLLCRPVWRRHRVQHSRGSTQRATGNYRSDRRDARDSRLHCPAARDPTADWPPDGGNRPTAPARRCHRTTGSRCAGQSRTNRAATVSVKSHRTDGPLSGWRGGD